MFLNKLKSILLFGFITSIGFSTHTSVTHIQIDSKSNGIMIKLNLDTIPDLENYTAWQANSGWFYITLYGVQGDSNNLSKVELPNSIQKFQIIESSESLQIGLQLKKPIENFNFDSSLKNNTLLIFLHYSTDQIAKLKPLNKNNGIQVSQGTPNGIKTWMNITGFSILFSGLITDSNNPLNSTTKTGLCILGTNYIIDKILRIL